MIIGFDADDTLWHNEDGFQASHRQFEVLLQEFAPPETVQQRLFETESRNLGRYGYGVKSYTLSMIETALALSNGAVSGAQVASMLDLGRGLLDRPVELIDGVPDVLDQLAEHTLMIITKGDLYHQLARINSCGLKDRFWRTEVVAHKTPDTYRSLLDVHGIPAQEFVMVGNSLPSDVLPVLEIGGRAVHVPYYVTWDHEHHDEPHDAPVLDRLVDLPALLADWGVS